MESDHSANSWQAQRARKAEARAREILGAMIGPEGTLVGHSPSHVFWYPDADEISLDGGFTVEQLEAIAWWMRNTPASRKNPGGGND